MVKLLAFDLDGTTITGPDNYISPRTFEAVNLAYKQGKTLVIATGRSLPFVFPIIERFDHIDYVIFGNGVGWYNCKTQEIFTDTLTKIDPETSIRVLNYVQRYPNLIQIQANQKVYVNSDSEKSLRGKFDAKYTKLIEDYIITVDDFLPIVEKFGIEKINAMFKNKQDRLKAFSKLYKIPNVFVSSSWEDNVEVNSIATSKGITLSALCIELGIDYQDVFAIGDNDNDVSMLEYAEYGYSFPDGSTDSRRAASFETNYAAEDGMANAIFDLLNLK
jgi:Cof subfamily protein (haloacid dehalogenase superfamily)